MTKNIVVIGGGTGSFMLLSALKEYSHSLTAIVSMADDGGSAGVLRDELGVLPPGDVRQCLVALSESPKTRDLFNYRFEDGTFAGHSFGNILLSTLEKVSGSFVEAVETASEILRVDGRVIPATLDDIRLKMSWDDKSVTLHGEHAIDDIFFPHDPRTARMYSEPKASANDAALNAIRQADAVLIAPGSLYTSLAPPLVIEGFGDVLRQTSAKVVYVCNLITKDGQTNDFTVVDHAAEIERFAGGEILDYVLYNTGQPAVELLDKYKEEGAAIVQPGESILQQHYEAIAGEFLGETRKEVEGDKLAKTRTFIRHDGEKLATAIMEMIAEQRDD